MFTYWCSHPGVDRVRNFKKSTNMGTCFVEQAPEWLQKPSIGLKFDLVWADGDWTIQIHTYFAGFLSAIKIQQKERYTHRTQAQRLQHIAWLQFLYNSIFCLCLNVSENCAVKIHVYIFVHAHIHNYIYMSFSCVSYR